MSGVEQYLTTIQSVLDRLGANLDSIEAAARTCADSILGGGLVYAFGSGHSRIIVEELWPRYGSYPGFQPIVELSLTSYHQVVGTNGMRQAMFLENVPGLAARIADNFEIRGTDALIAVSSGGTSVVTVELAQIFSRLGASVIAVTALEHSRRATTRVPSGKRLFEVADLVLDTCTPVGDAAVTLEGLAGPVGPTTTVAGCVLANALKVRTAELLVAAGAPPLVLPSAVVVGTEASEKAFEAAFDEHARRARRSP